MKPSLFVDGRWRLMVPGKKSPTGKRHAYYFKTRKDAEAKLKEIERFGVNALLNGKDHQAKKDADHWQYLVETYGLSNEQITNALRREVKSSTLKPGSVRDILIRYQEDRKRKVSPSTWDTARWRLLKLDRAYANQPITELTEDDLRTFFDEVTGDRPSIYTSLNTFFEWTIVHKYRLDNPLTNIEKGTFGLNKGYYSAEVFDRMLRIAAGLEAPRKGKEPTREFATMLPWFLLSGFCGLRCCEAYRLNRQRPAIRWDDLRLNGEKRPYVEIRHEVAKGTAKADRHRRVFTPLYIDALIAWLPLVPRSSEFVVPWTKRKMQDLKRTWKKATGLTFIENGFRNSFASYALAVENIEGIGHLAIEMGDSEAICKRHYVSSLKPLEGEKWFNLRPPQDSNVIPFTKVAVA